MIYNTTKLGKELNEADIIHDGVCVTDEPFKTENFPECVGYFEKDGAYMRVDFTPATTEQMKTDATAIIEAHTPYDYVAERKAEYPEVGEQLDNITKCLDFLRTNGLDMGEFGDLLVDTNLAVKIKFPKE